MVKRWPKELKQRAIDLRAEGMSQQKIAQELQVPRRTVRTWLSGK